MTAHHETLPPPGFQGRRLNLLEYHVPRARAGLASLLGVLESGRASLPIERYAVSQTTLEQVGPGGRPGGSGEHKSPKA